MDNQLNQTNLQSAICNLQSAISIKDALAQQGILIRYYRAPELRDCIRISVGTPAQNDTLLAALRKMLA